MLSFRLGDISIKRFLLPIVLVVISVFGVTEVRGQYTKVHATYVGPAPANTGGIAGAGGAKGGLFGSIGDPGSFSSIGANYTTNSNTLSAVSGAPGNGVLPGPGTASFTYVNLDFTSSIKPKAQAKIFIKAQVSSVSSALLNAENPKTRLSLQVYNSTGLVGASYKLSELNTNDAGEYVFITTDDCIGLRLTLTTDIGHPPTLILAGGPSTASAIIQDVYFYDPTCNVPTASTTEIIGLGLLGTGITNPDNAIDGNLSTSSKFNSGVLSALLTLKQTAFFSELSNPGEVATVTVGIPKSLVAVGVLGGVKVTAFNGTTSVGSQSFEALLQGTDLLGLLQSGAIATISLPTTGPFNRIEVAMTSLLNVATSLDLYEIQRTPAKPVFTSPASQKVTICSGNSVTFTPDPAGAGNELRWYKTAVGGLRIPGNTYTTGNITQNDTAYVAMAKIGCLGESERVPAVALINKVTPGSINISQTAICPGTSPPAFTSVDATGTSITYQWQKSVGNNTSYSDISGAAALLSTYTELTALTQTTYYRRIAKSTLNGVLCTANSNEVTITIKAIASLTSSLTPSICNNGLFNYTATTNTTATSIAWSRASISGISEAASNGTSNLISETLNNATSAPIDVPYVFTIISNGCTSTQTVTLKVYPTLTLSSTPSPPAICSNTLFSYTPTSAVVGSVLKWTRPGNSNISNAAVTVPVEGAINETLINTSSSPVVVTYNYTITINGCSVTQGVVVTVNPSPSISINPLNICEQTTNLILPYSNASTGLIAYNLTWNAPASTLGFLNKTNQVLGPNSININIPGNAPVGTYTANITVKSDTNCTSSDIGFTLKIIAKPGSPHLSIKIN